MNLPDDYIAFVRSGKQLEYDEEECEIRGVRLLPLEQLRVQLYPTDVENGPVDNSTDPHKGELGCYLVPGISLLAACEDYDPDGLLLWLPEEGCFGTWDSTHTFIVAFSSSVTWTNISSNPARHFNAFWGDDEIGGIAPLIPWRKYGYDPSRPMRPKPFEPLEFVL